MPPQRSRDEADVNELREELLRVRDDVVHLETEAGRLRGENEELRAQIDRVHELSSQLDGVLAELQAVLSSRRWRIIGRLLLPLDKLRILSRRLEDR
jgi:predicted nuclease with TOPRIM domain